MPRYRYLYMYGRFFPLMDAPMDERHESNADTYFSENFSDEALTKELIAAIAHVQVLAEEMSMRKITATILKTGHSALPIYIGHGAKGKLSVGIPTKALHEPTRN